DERILFEVVAENAQVVRFLRVIELAHDGALKLLEHQGERIAAALLSVLIEKRRDIRECFQVIEHLLLNTRPLNLHCYAAAIAQTRAMHLSERCGCDRLYLE